MCSTRQTLELWSHCFDRNLGEIPERERIWAFLGVTMPSSNRTDTTLAPVPIDKRPGVGLLLLQEGFPFFVHRYFPYQLCFQRSLCCSPALPETAMDAQSWKTVFQRSNNSARLLTIHSNLCSKRKTRHQIGFLWIIQPARLSDCMCKHTSQWRLKPQKP